MCKSCYYYSSNVYYVIYYVLYMYRNYVLFVVLPFSLNEREKWVVKQIYTHEYLYYTTTATWIFYMENSKMNEWVFKKNVDLFVTNIHT